MVGRLWMGESSGRNPPEKGILSTTLIQQWKNPKTAASYQGPLERSQLPTVKIPEPKPLEPNLKPVLSYFPSFSGVD
jgi:hypothetical protein